MITGNDPLFIFNFNVPFLGIPFLIVPIALNEEATGLVERKVDTAITIATETVGSKMIQKSFSDSLSLEFAAKKDSLFSTMIVPLLKKVFTSANIKDLTFGLLDFGFNYANNYSISYFSGNQYVIGGILTAFDYGNQDNTDLINVSMTIASPPSLTSDSIAGDVLQKTSGNFVNNYNSVQSSAAQVTTNYQVAPSSAVASAAPGSISPYPGVY